MMGHADHNRGSCGRGAMRKSPRGEAAVRDCGSITFLPRTAPNRAPAGPREDRPPLAAGARQQGEPPRAQPTLRANRCRRAETARAGAEVQRYRANRYG